MYQMSGTGNHTLDDPADRIGYLLWQTAHLVNRGMSLALQPFDLTPAQFGALVHTGREPGISAAELARRINLTPQSIQTAIRPLIERTWMERRPHPVHRRVLGNFLTEAGLTATQEAGVAVSSADAHISAAFEGAVQEQFTTYVRRALLALNPTALDRSSLRNQI